MRSKIEDLPKYDFDEISSMVDSGEASRDDEFISVNDFNTLVTEEKQMNEKEWKEIELDDLGDFLTNENYYVQEKRKDMFIPEFTIKCRILEEVKAGTVWTFGFKPLESIRITQKMFNDYYNSSFRESWCKEEDKVFYVDGRKVEIIGDSE